MTLNTFQDDFFFPRGEIPAVHSLMILSSKFPLSQSKVCDRTSLKIALHRLCHSTPIFLFPPLRTLRTLQSGKSSITLWAGFSSVTRDLASEEYRESLQAARRHGRSLSCAAACLFLMKTDEVCSTICVKFKPLLLP